MMFSGTEDDDLFNPTSHVSSNLASLFGTSMNPPQNSDQSLIYTAPRQPKTKTDETVKEVTPHSKQQSQSSVFCAKLVTLYKQEKSAYTKIGKYGLALIGTESQTQHEIILYKDKQNILIRVKVQGSFNYTVQNDNYSSFYDDNKQNWLLHFEKEADFIEFYTEVKKRGANIINKTHNETDKKILEDSPKSLDQRDSVSDTGQEVENKEEPQSDSSDSKIKQNILSRMAKMGQPILPTNLLKNVKSDATDSESDIQNAANTKPIRKPRRHIPDKAIVASNSNTTNTGIAHGPLNLPTDTSAMQFPLPNVPYSYVNTQMVPLQSSVVPQFQNIPGQFVYQQAHVSDALSNALISESRIHNSEVRINLSQISNKLDELTSKFNKTESGANENQLLSKIKALELKADNLMRELDEKSIVICQLEEENLLLKEAVSDRSYKEEIEKQQALLVAKNGEIEELKERLTNKESELAKNEQELNDLNHQLSYLKYLIMNLENSDETIATFKTFSENKGCMEECDLNLLHEKILIYKDKYCTLQNHYKENLQKQSDLKLENKLKVMEYKKKVEKMMADLYQHTMKQLNVVGDNLPLEFASKTFPKTIKAATNYLIELQEDFLTENSLSHAVVTADLKDSCDDSDTHFQA